MSSPMPFAPLTPIEARVLAVLVEKQHTVPDTYPLSLNALVAGCCQKTSRDPVMDVGEGPVREALASLRARSLVIETSGGRVMRYEHNARRVLGVPAESVALLATLMLRGPQTAAELRANCERIHRFSDVSATEAYLEEMAARGPAPYVRRLERRPGSREHRWAHLLCGEPAAEPAPPPRPDGAPKPVVECYFDCSSPWTWLGVHNLVPLAEAQGAAIAWKPILVGGVFNAVNPSVYASRENPVPAKRAYMLKDLQDWARLAGLAIRFPPSVFPVNSVKAMRGCVWLEPRGLLLPFARAVFEAYWTRDEDVSRDEVLVPLVERLGVDGAEFLAAIATQPVKDALRANTEALIARGGFGSPTFFVGEDMYFGNDRLPLLREALRRARG